MNNWILDIRDESYFGLHVGIAAKCTELLYRRCQMYANYEAALPTKILSALHDVSVKATNKTVRPSSTTLCDVDGRVVDLTIPSCTCGYYNQIYLPCVHMTAAIKLTDRPLTDYVHDVYKVSSLRRVYASVIVPIDLNYVVPDGYTKPSEEQRQAGRPRKIRLRNASDMLPEDSLISCSLCLGLGHNKRTCARRAQQLT